MSSLFYSAYNFNQNLCLWFGMFPRQPIVSDMFVVSGCADASDPNFVTEASF